MSQATFLRGDARHARASASKTMHGLLAAAAVSLLSACATVAPPPAAQPPITTSPAPAPVPRPAAPPPAPVSSAEQAALRNLVAQQDRLYRVAAPLLVNNAELCRKNARNLLGFTAKNKYSYSADFVNAAESVLGMGESLKVTGVLDGSGAARAGLRRGDELVAIEDKPLPQGPNAERQAAGVIGPLIGGRNNVRLTVLRNGAQSTLNVPLTNACAFGIELGNADHVNAYNDGYRVLVTRGMLNAVRSDEELAYVVAKEMAHNILGHANRLRLNATAGGIIDNLIRLNPDMSSMAGMSGLKPMPQDLDAIADRLALFLVARAGYGIDGAPAFWQRMASQYPASMANSYTALHPSTQFRVNAMQRTIADINAKRGGKRPLLP